MQKPVKVYPSSFSMPSGNTVDTPYNSGCLRYLKFKDHIPANFPYQSFPELNTAIGIIGEERARQLLADRYPGVEMSIEESFKQYPDANSEISGRCDFLLTAANLIVEVKTTRSATVRSNVITRGNLPERYLGQLVTYLVAFDITQGEILVQYVHLERDLRKLGFVDRIFTVKLDGDAIIIDGVRSETYTVGRILSYYELYINTMRADKIPPKPVSDKACYFCPFNSICNNLNVPATPAEFIEAAKTLEFDFAKKPAPPTLPRHNIRSR